MPCALCARCKKDIKRICTACGYQTDEQFHACCFYIIDAYQVSLTLMDGIAIEGAGDGSQPYYKHPVFH